jgi:anti-sigma B factor antagonist
MGQTGGMTRGFAPVLADGFIIHVIRQDDDFCVVVAGELDRTTSPALARQIEMFVDQEATVTIDLRDVSFMDTTALLELWAISHAITSSGGRLVLKAPSRAVLRVLELTQLEQIFEVQGARATVC